MALRVSLVVLAAGLSTRYGRLKQLDPVGPSGEALMDYGIFDAVRAGVGRVVPVVREEIADEVTEHVGTLVGDAAEVRPALQELGDVPGGVPVPEERAKPWGTGHAVLAARDLLDGPFLVMNADDFYGREAFARLVEWASGPGDGVAPGGTAGGIERAAPAGPAAPAVAALVPYRLRDALSPHGGVSRAVLDVESDGTLAGVREVFRIRGAEEDGGRRPPGRGPGGRGAEGRGAESRASEAAPGGVAAPLVGEERDGDPVALTGDELFSANLWGFRPEVLPLLEEGFASFLRERGGEPGAEYLVADGLRPGLRSGRLRVRVLEPGRTWLGVTHPDDREAVAARLREMVQAGAYPSDLRAAADWAPPSGPPQTAPSPGPEG